jgi:hypothetical protein
MMEVHRQSGGFTPPVEAKRRSRLSGSKMPQRGAQLNVFDFLFNRGGMKVALESTYRLDRLLFH